MITITYKTIDQHAVKANIFLPQNSNQKQTPVFLYFHGGGFMMGNRDLGLHPGLKDALLAQGIAVISADYRLAPETPLEGIVADVYDALTWVRNHTDQYNFNPQKIIVAGGSAGGYLALTTGYKNKLAPQAIVSISAPTGNFPSHLPMGDLEILKNASVYKTIQPSAFSYGDYETRAELWDFLAKNNLLFYHIFGFDPAKHPEKLEPFHPKYNIHQQYPPTLILHAKDDEQVALKEAIILDELLQSQSLQSKLHIYEHGHSSTLLNQNPEAITSIVDFVSSI